MATGSTGPSFTGAGVWLQTCLRCALLGILLPISAAAVQKPASSAAPPARDVDNLLAAAAKALDREDFETAVKNLEAVLEGEPEMTAAWFNLGYAFTALRRNEEAVAAYKKTLELQPDLFEAHLNLGILFLEMKQPHPALEHLEKAAALRPNHTRAQLYYGRALSRTGASDAAEQHFREALQLEPGLAIAHFDLGQLQLSRKQYAEALASFQKAGELDSQLPQSQLGIALALEGLNRQAEALTYFDRYLAAQPDDLETRFHVARIYLDQRKPDAAIENLEQVYRADPDLPGLAAALGDAFALAQRFGESEKFYRQALVQTPQETDLHRALAQNLLEQHKFPEAEGEFRAALQLDPKNHQALRGLATSIYLQKRYAEAIPLFEELAKMPNAPAGMFFVLATCYDHLQARREALAAYERFLQLSANQNPDQEWQARQRVKLLQRLVRK